MNAEKPRKKKRRLALLIIALILALIAYALIFSGGDDKKKTDPDAEKVAASAMEQLGVKYVFGANKPGEAFDCSAFVSYVYSLVGIEFAPLAQTIGYDDRFERVEDIRALEMGDILCFDTIVDKDRSDHVAISLGDGKFIHASSEQGAIVINSIDDYDGYYVDRFSWALRVFGD